MNLYKLLFGGSEFGDELILPEGFWEGRSSSSQSESGLEHISGLDDRPLSIALYPRFQIRKKASDFWEFERWVFELVDWADGERRELFVIDNTQVMQVNYGRCKLTSVTRPKSSGPDSARWSDRVILTFQAESLPKFYDWS